MKRTSLAISTCIVALLLCGCEYTEEESESLLIYPGDSVGPIHSFSDRDEIAYQFHEYEIEDIWISPVPGWKIPITRITENGSPFLDLIWDIEINFSGELDRHINLDEISNASVYAVRVYTPKYNLLRGLSTESGISEANQVLEGASVQRLYDSSKSTLYLILPKMIITLSDSDSSSANYEITFGSEFLSDSLLAIDIADYRIQYIDVIMTSSSKCSTMSTIVCSLRNWMRSSITGPPRYMQVDSAAVCLEVPAPFSLELLFHPLQEYQDYEYSVDLWVYINESGIVSTTPYLYNSSGIDILDRAALHSVAYSAWQPAIRQGQNYAAWTVLQLNLEEQ